MLIETMLATMLLGAGFEDVVSPSARMERVATGYRFVEGPAWDGKDSLYFSDIPANRIIRLGPGDVTTVFRADSGQSNGLMFDARGRLVACEHRNRRISRTEPDGTIVAVVDRIGGKRLNSPNDLVIDSAGGVYFTDPRYGSRDDLELNTEDVYYVTAAGELSRVSQQPTKPNGIALSPDGTVLYVADNGASNVLAYRVSAPGKIGRGRIVARLTGGPDGMCVDTAGRLYVTGPAGIWVFDPPGQRGASLLGILETPEHPANCTFGGPENDILYITARTSLYRIQLNAKGIQASATDGH